MKKILLWSIMFLMCVSAGMADAQSLYIKRDKDKKQSSSTQTPQKSRSNFYVQPDSKGRGSSPTNRGTYKFRQPVKKVDSVYDSKIRFVQDTKNLNERIQLFKEWQASGQKPKTSEEILAYSKLSRASNEAMVFRRRKAMILAYEKQEKLREKRRMYARQNEMRRKMDFSYNYKRPGNEKTADTEEATRTPNKVNTTTIKRRGFFVRPDDKARNRREKKSRVYTGY